MDLEVTFGIILRKTSTRQNAPPAVHGPKKTPSFSIRGSCARYKNDFSHRLRKQANAVGYRERLRMYVERIERRYVDIRIIQSLGWNRCSEGVE